VTLTPALLDPLPDTFDPYPRALDALHQRTAPGRLVSSPTGHVLASPALLPDAPPGPFTPLGLAVADAGADSAFGIGPTADRFAAGLLHLHAEALRDTLQHALHHLSSRTSAGATLLSRQLVQGEIADIAMSLAEHQAMPFDHRDADRHARWRAYLRLVAGGRRALRLFGASGFLASGPGGRLHLAEAVGNVYLHPAVEDPDD
jgi:hypothetical protein